MESRSFKEREIILGDIAWKIIMGWRFILVFTIVLSLLAAGAEGLRYRLAYVQYQNALEEQALTLSQEKESAAEKYVFSGKENEEIQNALLIERFIGENKRYIQNSILMDLNAYEVPKLRMQYYVDLTSDYDEDTEFDHKMAVINAYQSFVVSSALSQKFVDDLELNIERLYIEELISYGLSDGGNGFYIEVVFDDEDTLLAMADIIKNELEDLSAKIDNDIDPHTLVLLSDEVKVTMDAKIADRQSREASRIYSYQSQLNTAKANMTEEQLAALKAGGELLRNNNESQPAPIIEPTYNYRTIILSAIVGIMLAVIWLMVRWIFARKLQSCIELEDIYGMRLLGTVEAADKQKGKVYLKLKQLKNRGKRILSENENLELIVSNIELFCKKNGLNLIYITGSELEKVDEHIMNDIKAHLQDSGFQVSIGENICYDAKSLKEINNMDGVVIIEQEGVSGYKEIEREILAILEQKVTVIGCVGVE